jgi:Undecaprenyl-phosphate glucose phosphotransferase
MQAAFACPLQDVASHAGKKKPVAAHISADLFSIAFDFLIVLDSLSVLASGLLAARIYANPGELDDQLVRVSLIGAVLSPIVLREGWSHLAFSTISPAKLVVRILTRVGLAALLIFAVACVTGSPHRLPLLWAATWFIGAAVGVICERFLVLAAMRSLAARGLVADRVAVLGCGPAAEWLMATLAEAHPYGVTAINAAVVGPAYKLEQALTELVELGRQGQIDRVVLALPDAGEQQLQTVAHRLKALEIEVTSLYPAFAKRGAAVRSTQIAGVPLYLITRRPQYRWGVLAKAIEDRVLALLLLFVFSPVLALVALAVRLDSPGPVIFRQRRHGLNGTEFEVLKFRTMVWQGARAGSGDVQTCRGDSRLTRVGGFLRSTSLDELPQLLNVLSGKMSLVGPRPHPVSMRTEQQLGDEIIAEYAHRHRVKPGITGWAQVNGLRGATDTAEKLRRRVELDIYYIENWSLPFDLRILVSTVFLVLFKRSNAF